MTDSDRFDPVARSVDRRTVLRTALLAGGASAALAALPASAGATLPSPLSFPDPPPAPATGGIQFFTDPFLDFQTRFAFGAAGYGAAEFGEVLTFVNEANEAGGTYQAFVDACSAMAAKVAEHGRRAERAGDTVTAAACQLRASEYEAQSLYFVLGTSTPEAEPAVYQRMRDAWDAFCRLTVPRVREVKIPYEKSTLTAWLLTPQASGEARPTVILNNGSDAQCVELWGYGGASALARGYNALIFEGPGQGAMLFEKEIPFRPDWEKVVGPVIDFLEDQDAVDESKLALIGWSMGGELVVRAAAFEPRLAAVVADPGAVSIWDAWPADARAVADAGTPAQVNAEWADAVATFSPAQAFNVRKRAEIFGKQLLRQAREGKVPTDFAALSSAMQQFQVRDVAGRVKMPALVTKYEGDQSFGSQPEEMIGLLGSARKDLVEFTAAEGAQLHCGPMAPQRRNEVIFDWLDDVLR